MIGLAILGAAVGGLAAAGMPPRDFLFANGCPPLPSAKRRNQPTSVKRPRGRRPRHEGWTVAEGKRRARKRRNQLRHKAHLRRRK